MELVERPAKGHRKSPHKSRLGTGQARDFENKMNYKDLNRDEVKNKEIIIRTSKSVLENLVRHQKGRNDLSVESKMCITTLEELIELHPKKVVLTASCTPEEFSAPEGPEPVILEDLGWFGLNKYKFGLTELRVIPGVIGENIDQFSLFIEETRLDSDDFRRIHPFSKEFKGTTVAGNQVLKDLDVLRSFNYQCKNRKGSKLGKTTNNHKKTQLDSLSQKPLLAIFGSLLTQNPQFSLFSTFIFI